MEPFIIYAPLFEGEGWGVYASDFFQWITIGDDLTEDDGYGTKELAFDAIDAFCIEMNIPKGDVAITER